MTMHAFPLPGSARRPPLRSAARVRRLRCPEPGLRLDLVFTRSGLRLAVTGELDLATAGRLELWLGRFEQLCRPVMLDLNQVRFADCAGIAPLLDSALRRRRAGKPPLVLVASSAAVDRVLWLLAGDDGVNALVRRPSDGGEAAPYRGVRRRLTATSPPIDTGRSEPSSKNGGDEITSASGEHHTFTNVQDRGTA